MRRHAFRPRQPAFNVHGLGFTLFLALLTVLPPLAIDMALPSLALIQADLHAPQTKAAAVIAIFIAGFSTAPIVGGPLADRFGRKAIMTASLVVFTLTSAGAALAPSIDALLASSPRAGRGRRRGRHPAAGDHPRLCSRAVRLACSSRRSRSCSASGR